MLLIASLPWFSATDSKKFYLFTSIVYVLLGAWLLVLINQNTLEIWYWFQLWLYLGLAAVLMQPVMRYWWFAGILSLGLLLISSLKPQEIVQAQSHVPWDAGVAPGKWCPAGFFATVPVKEFEPWPNWLSRVLSLSLK